MEGIDLFDKILVFVEDFVSMEKEGRGQEFGSLEVREASSSHLKMKVYKTN